LKKEEVTFKVGIHSCAAAVVNENWIMTSAHCTQKHPNKFAVAYGHGQDLVAMFDAGRILLEEIHRHPNFSENQNKYLNDIALIKLSSPLPLDGENVSAACFNFDSEEASESLMTMFGWGASTPPRKFKGFWDHQSQSRNLRELKLLDNTATEEMCADREDIMCAVTFGDDAWNQGACKGDDGSAVHKNIKGNWKD
jgi:secreted trypsin-like serine protease